MCFNLSITNNSVCKNSNNTLNLFKKLKTKYKKGTNSYENIFASSYEDPAILMKNGDIANTIATIINI